MEGELPHFRNGVCAVIAAIGVRVYGPVWRPFIDHRPLNPATGRDLPRLGESDQPTTGTQSALFEKPALDPEPKSASQVWSFESSFKAGDIIMRSKLAISALVVASLLGATAIASAQTQPAPGASSEGNVGPGATGSKMKSDKMKSSKMKSGTTTGMNSGSQKGNKTDKNNDSK
jgi:hypothetical protein